MSSEDIEFEPDLELEWAVGPDVEIRFDSLLAPRLPEDPEDA